MNDTQNQLRDRIAKAFGHLYPDKADHTDGILINFNPDETIDVELEGVTTFRAEPESDNDNHLRFRLYDPDYELENPEDDPYDYLMIRIRVL